MSKNFNQVLNSLKRRLTATLPSVDLSDGAIIRELIDAYAQEAAIIYSQLDTIQNLQSIRTASGNNLDNLAANYSKQRKKASYASSMVLFTRANLSANDSIFINSGIIVSTLSVSTSSGTPVQFKTVAETIMDGSQREILKATGNQYRSFLDSYGISDQYAIAVPVVATAPGTAGNVARGSIRQHSMSNIGHVINIVAGTGGADSETDEDFRKRLLLVFAGSNLSTEFGLRSFILDNEGIQDVAIVGPGNPLMIRDGSKVEGGVIEVPGSGGMIDVYLAGKKLERNTESFIFVDKSPNGDITDSSNDYVLGVATYTDPLTNELIKLDYHNRKALIDNSSIELMQPIDSIVSVSGSQSGTFAPGINYTLLKDINTSDSTVYSNSGFGNDRLKWLSNTIRVTNEPLKRSSSTMQDFTAYTDITSIDDIYYNIKINRELAIVTDQTDIVSNVVANLSYDPTTVVKIITKHSPITNITSVENFLTGEKYKVEFFSTDGYAYISGRSLPSTSDTVLISYEWKKFANPLFDYGLAENAILWSNRNTSLLSATKSSSSGATNTFWPNAYGVVSPTSSISKIGTLKTPTELMVTAKCKSLNTRAVYLQGTTMTMVINQSQTLSEVPSLDNTDTYLEFHITPPKDSRTGAVVGGTYDSDLITSYKVLARKGDYIGRVYPNNNPLDIDGTLTVSTSENESAYAEIIYENVTSGEPATYVDYITDSSDATYIGIKASDISTPSTGDTISISYIWEVRHPISQGASLSKYPDGSYKYILGSESGTSDNVIRNVNNPSYRNPNTGTANLGNYDKISYVGSISSVNSTQISYKKFITLDRISISDLQSPSDPTFTDIKIQQLQSPPDNSTYSINYTYIAPKVGERITVAYLYNKMVNDITKEVESQRLINTDILVREAIEVPLSVGLSAVISDAVDPVSTQSDIATSLESLLSTNALGGSLEPSFISSELFKAVTGLVSVNFTRFSRLSDNSGVKSINLNDNEYYSIEPANIAIVVSSGKESIYTNYFTEGKTNPSFTRTGQASTCPAEKLIVADPKSCSPR